MKAAVRLLLVLALVVPALAPAQAQTGTVTTPAPTCRLFAAATIVGYNTKVRLDWKSTNATAGYLTAVGPIAPQGSATVVPGKNTTYAASFSGPGGTIVCRVAIAVQGGWQAGSGSTGSTGSGGGGGSTGAPYSGGVVNINGTTDVQSSSIDAPTPVSGGSSGSGTTGSGGFGIDTNNPVNTGGSAIDTNTPVNTSGSAINTGGGDRSGATTNLGGGITLPTAPSVLPQARSTSGFAGGLVPAECRGASTVANCDLCSLAQMGQNLANFLLGLSIPAAALLFAWAGILYFSSRGSPAQIEQAHRIFKRVVIGIVIALSAWVLVNTVMNMLVQGRDYQGWSWRTLSCAETRKARLYNMNLTQYLNSSLPGLTSYNPASSGSAFGESCPQGGELRVTETGNWCITANGGYAAAGPGGAAGVGIGGSSGGYTLTAAQEDKYTSECAAGNEASCSILEMVGEPTSGVAGRCPSGSVYSEGSCYNPITDTISDPLGSTISNPQMASQIETACSQISSVNCQYARSIALNESGGGRNCSTSSTGAAGCMQVLATTACGVDPSISEACGACSASRQSLSAQCAPVIQAINNDPQIGVNLGVQYISNMQNMPALRQYHSQYGTCQITAAAYYAGPGAVISAGGNIHNVRVPAGAPSASSYVAKACS